MKATEGVKFDVNYSVSAAAVHESSTECLSSQGARSLVSRQPISGRKDRTIKFLHFVPAFQYLGTEVSIFG